MVNRVGHQFGNYRLVQLLGAGGFAEVYLGEHVHLGTQAAVKVLITKLTSHDLQQFRQEAQTIARLIHPNIVRVFDFGEEKGVPFLVMDYAPGGSLRQRHPRGIRLPLAAIVAYVKQIAAALQCAHTQNPPIIHRDIKPENILVGRHNEILLSDFGIAIVSSSIGLQPTQNIAGTWPYMAPEQIQARPRRASDQYALGIVVYEWLTGNPPFQGSLAELAIKHASVQPPPLYAQVPGIPFEVEQVVFRALAKDPSQRFTNTQAFADALEQASQRPPIGTTLYTYSGHSSSSTSSTDTVHVVVWSPDGRQIASGHGDRTVQVWEANTGKQICIYHGHVADYPRPAFSGVYAVAWSPDGRRIVSGGGNGTIQVWEANTGNQIYRTEAIGIGIVYAVSWSPDGQNIASGGPNGKKWIWKANGEPLNGEGDWDDPLDYDDVMVLAVVYSPDGTCHAWGTSAGNIYIRIETGGLWEAEEAHSNRVRALAWAPDGRRVVSGSFDTTVKIWDMPTWSEQSYLGAKQPTYVYRGHSNKVRAVAWSPDGRRIASGADDQVVQVWEANTGKQICTYQGHAGRVTSVAWSPDGRQIASASDDGTVQIWQGV